jgi:hypothetical protein
MSRFDKYGPFIHLEVSSAQVRGLMDICLWPGFSRYLSCVSSDLFTQSRKTTYFFTILSIESMPFSSTSILGP